MGGDLRSFQHKDRHANLMISHRIVMDYKDVCLTLLVALSAFNTVINLRAHRKR